MADTEVTIANPPDDEVTFPDIYLIQEADVVKGGLEGISNKQAIGLVARTQWLKVLLMQILGMFSKLQSQGQQGDMTMVGTSMGLQLGDTGANVIVETTETGKFNIALTSGTDVTARVFYRHFTPTNASNGIKDNTPLTSTKTYLFDTALPFGDSVEGEVTIELKTANFRINTNADGTFAFIWTRSA